MEFSIEATDKKTRSRAGTLVTGHGRFETPVFMPVGTGGTVKGLSRWDLEKHVGAEIILGNTYHLYLRPGSEILKEAGGLHRFMNWERSILTDSGGYQVFSLADKRKISEEGVVFQSHIDGSRHTFTPEGVVGMQRVIGSDIMMALDDCTPYPVGLKEAGKSMELTHRWLSRGWKAFCESEPLYGFSQAFFAIVQGSTFPDLRRQSAMFVAETGAAGNAIGGLSVGEPAELMYQMVETVNEILPEDRPRYLMGVGTPANMLEAVARGIDMFDCVMPTRNARNGMLFTSEGTLHIRNLKWKNDFSPIDPAGTSLFSREYTRAYLRHLTISGEILGSVIASVHNLSFYSWLMAEARKKIILGDFAGWKETMVKKLSQRQ